MHTSRRRCRKHYSLALALLLAPLQLYAQSEQKPGVADYITGVDALTTADYPRAIHALTTAITADPDNPSYRRARGIANTLNESFPDAIIDLQRAQQINPNDTEARLWLAAAYRMSNDPAKGASLFTMRDLPHDYANLVYNLMAMQYWQSRYRGAYFDPTTHTSITTTSPIKTLFPDCAKAFADRNRATGPGVTEAITAQMKSALAANDFTTALYDLAQLRANDPDNPDLRAAYAQSLLGAGNALQAREEFTRTLNSQPLWPEGYLGRAQAHAQLGDHLRAQGDLVIATPPLDPVKILPPIPSMPDAAQKFAKPLLQSDTPFPQLVDAALALHHLTNSTRKYYDESYQDRIRLLARLQRDHPADSLYPETLARYLVNNVTVPTLWNGPRATPLQLRPQSSAEYKNELQRAFDLTDLAAKLDPKNANALATKARILYFIQAAGAEQLADQALALDPDNFPALTIKSQILANHAADCLAQAAGLRAGHSESHTETRSEGEYRVTTHYPPTAEQLAQAAQLEAQATQLRQQQSQVDTHRHEVAEKTIPALLQKKNLKSAQLALAKDPDRPETLRLLYALYLQQNDFAHAHLYLELVAPLEQTTAAPQLQSAWTAITHTQYEAASKLLDQAAQLDPSDARTPAYRSIIDSHRDTPDPTTAHHNFRAALALEEARARESGTTLLISDSPTTPELLTPDLAALTLALHLHAGHTVLGTNHPDLALAEFSANTALQPRLPTSALTQLLPLAMLPAPTQDPNSIPPAPTLASLLANSHLGLARCYLATNHPDQAKSEFTATRAYRANWPATAPNRESLTIPDAYARLGLAELAYAKHDIPQTLQILESDGWPGNLPPDLDARRKQLADQAHANLSNQSWQSVQQQMSQSPQQARIQSLQQEITQLQQQRDAIATDLKTPTLSDRDRQVRQSSLDALDSLITQRKATLQKLQSP